MNRTTDILSAKIRSKHNDYLENKSFCYIGTNELDLSSTKKMLVQNKKENNQICHIGTSGWYNFDILCITKSDRCVIFDYNNNQITFLKQTLRNIKQNETRKQFVRAMNEYLIVNKNIYTLEHTQIIKDHGYNANNKILDRIHKKCVLFYPNVSSDESYSNYYLLDHDTDQINNELTRKDSWLSTDTNYLYIRSLVVKDKISIICEDIINTLTFKYIVSLLNENFVLINTVYLSNIQDYISYDNKSQFISTIKVFSYNNPLIIHCTSYDSLRQKINSVNEYLDTI